MLNKCSRCPAIWYKARSQTFAPCISWMADSVMQPMQ